MANPDPDYFRKILEGSVLPPGIRMQMPANPRPRTPEESLDVLATIITGLAQRGADPANGLRVTTNRDDRGMTIRIDLP